MESANLEFNYVNVYSVLGGGIFICSIQHLDFVCPKLQFRVLKHELPCAAAVLTLDDLELEVSKGIP